MPAKGTFRALIARFGRAREAMIEEIERVRFARALPLHGHRPRAGSPALDSLSDDELARLNRLMGWSSFTADGAGRMFGRPGGPRKRWGAMELPDPRAIEFDSLSPLAGRSVIEFGCLDGVNTVSLARLGARVLAVDVRVENVACAMVRCGFHSADADFRVVDLDGAGFVGKLPRADAIFHVGVLYHLEDPVGHLRALGSAAPEIYLDTHFATEAMARALWRRGDEEFRVHERVEKPESSFAGSRSRSRWLLLEDIDRLLAEAGYRERRVLHEDGVKSKPRVRILARSAAVS